MLPDGSDACKKALKLRGHFSVAHMAHPYWVGDAAPGTCDPVKAVSAICLRQRVMPYRCLPIIGHVFGRAIGRAVYAINKPAKVFFGNPHNISSLCVCDVGAAARVCNGIDHRPIVAKIRTMFNGLSKRQEILASAIEWACPANRRKTNGVLKAVGFVACHAMSSLFDTKIVYYFGMKNQGGFYGQR